MVFKGRVARARWGCVIALCVGLAQFAMATDGTPPPATPAPGASDNLPNNCVGKVLATTLKLNRDLDQARRETAERLRKSPNARAIADFILKTESPIQPTLVSTNIPGFGKIRIQNDLRAGTSRVEWLDETGKLKETIFDSMNLARGTSKKIAREIKWGRVDSVHLAPDGSQIIVRYRPYSLTDSKRLMEVHHPTGLKTKTPVAPEAALYKVLNNFQEGTPFKVASGNYYVRNYGMNASTDVVFVANDGTPSILFSTLDEHPNNTVQFGSFSVSPDEKYLSLTTYNNGSLDDFRLKIIDRASNVVVADLPIRSQTPSWEGTKLSVLASDAHGQRTWAEIDPQKPKPSIEIATGPMKPGRWTSTVSKKDDTHIYLAQGDSGDVTELRIIDKDSPTGRKVAVIHNDYIIDTANMMGDAVAVTSRRGGERQVDIITTKPGAAVLASIRVPEGVSLGHFSWVDDQHNAMNFYAQSDVNSWLPVKYDRTTQVFNPPDFASKSLTRDGVEYASNIVQIPSRDGTLIPLRITGRADALKKGNLPVYMEVYGGFGNESPNFDPAYDAMHYEFLRRGGAIASPAARGGSEFGQKWYEAAKGLHKDLTLEDVAAAARYLIEQHVTEPRKIILKGTSNGGFVAAATALRYPDTFGLVIPTNGVLDFSRAETFDARVGAWIKEYGSNDVPEELANKERLSPVLQAANLANLKQAPEFLIVNGAKDSRVNPAHSINFYRALRKAHPNPSSVLLLQTNHSGHSGETAYEKLTGWNTRALIWTRIFDFVGWKF